MRPNLSEGGYTRPYEFSELVCGMQKEDTIESEPLQKESVQPTHDIHVQSHEQPLATSSIHEKQSDHEKLSPQATPYALIDNVVIIPPSNQVYGEEDEDMQDEASLTVLTKRSGYLDFMQNK